ncbi:MAG TPA: hypothetical protein VFH19_06760 [Nitrososphaeraceae archaeon]|nr:hypothetical protein [Nitrososphaeraceae archaeon]
MKLRTKKKNNKKDDYFDSNKDSSDLQMMKNELDSLEVERSIITSSVRKIHETFREGKLSQLEFDRLMTKYAEDLGKCEQEMEQTRSVVDLYELSSIKNNLVSIIEDKIKVIDARLSEISNGNVKMLTRQPKQSSPDTTYQDLANTSLGQGNLEKSLHMEAEKIKNLEYEITQALEKLDSYESRKSESKSAETGDEQILEKNLDQSSTLNVTNKKDPLRNFTSSD